MLIIWNHTNLSIVINAIKMYLFRELYLGQHNIKRLEALSQESVALAQSSYRRKITFIKDMYIIVRWIHKVSPRYIKNMKKYIQYLWRKNCVLRIVDQNSGLLPRVEKKILKYLTFGNENTRCKKR